MNMVTKEEDEVQEIEDPDSVQAKLESTLQGLLHSLLELGICKSLDDVWRRPPNTSPDPYLDWLIQAPVMSSHKVWQVMVRMTLATSLLGWSDKRREYMHERSSDSLSLPTELTEGICRSNDIIRHLEKLYTLKDDTQDILIPMEVIKYAMRSNFHLSLPGTTES